MACHSDMLFARYENGTQRRVANTDRVLLEIRGHKVEQAVISPDLTDFQFPAGQHGHTTGPMAAAFR